MVLLKQMAGVVQEGSLSNQVARCPIAMDAKVYANDQTIHQTPSAVEQDHDLCLHDVE